MVGDTMNTASRLESYDKELVAPDADARPCHTPIDETTLVYLADQFETAQVGETRLKGTEHTVRVNLAGPPAGDAAWCRRDPRVLAEREGDDEHETQFRAARDVRSVRAARVVWRVSTARAGREDGRCVNDTGCRGGAISHVWRA
jgi:hypothetical protein